MKLDMVQWGRVRNLCARVVNMWARIKRRGGGGGGGMVGAGNSIR